MSIYTDAQTDSADLAKLVNEDTDVTTRYGAQPKKSIPKVVREFEEAGDYAIDSFNQEGAESISEFDQVIDQYKESRGFNTKGTFADGFTYELPNDVGLDVDGNPWIYNGTLPFTVTAGTAPTSPTYTQVVYGNAAQVSTNTSDTVQSFVDSFALKIFQSPTDGGLTEIQTRTVDANEVYEVRKTSDDSLATIYSDAAGTIEIVQNGTSNVSDSAGVVEFYIADGDYYVEAGEVSSTFNVVHLTSNSIHYLFDTVSDMINSSKSFVVGKPLQTKGYYSVGDGGNAEYIIKTLAQSTADGDIVDDLFNHNLNNGNVAILQTDKACLSILKAGAQNGQNIYENLKAVVSRGMTAVVPAGNYLWEGTIDYSEANSISIIGHGKVNITGDFNLSNSGIQVVATTTTVATRNELSFSVDNVSDINTGDVIAILNPSDFSWHAGKDSWKQGEFLEVLRVNGNSLEFFTELYDTYPIGMEVWHIPRFKVQIENVNFIAEGACHDFRGVVGMDISKSTFSALNSGTDFALNIAQCYKVKLSLDGKESSTPLSGTNYAVALSNSQSIRVDGRYSAGRHAIGIGGGGEGLLPVSRDIVIRDCELSSNVGSQAATDPHHNVDDVRYVNCNIHGAIAFGGRNIRYYGCSSTQLQQTANGNPDPLGVEFTDAYGGEYGLYNHRFSAFVTSDFAAPNNTAFISGRLSNLKEPLIFKMINCQMDLPNQEGNVGIITTDNLDFPFSWVIEGGEYLFPSLSVASGIFTIVESNINVSAKVFKVSDSVYLDAAIPVAFNRNDSAGSTCRMIGPTQQGRVPFTISAGTNDTGNINIDFPNSFGATPRVITSVITPVLSQPAIAKVHAETTNKATLRVDVTEGVADSQIDGFVNWIARMDNVVGGN